MAFVYDKVVPWGRSFDEYRRMFALSDGELELRILGCGDGPASFNAGMKERGSRVVSCDPIYAMSAGQIRARIDATYDEVLEKTRRNLDRFVWDELKTPARLGIVRMEAMEVFLADFEQGKQQGRYVEGSLPELPFECSSFDLALCSHFLFLYSDNLSLEFHQQAIAEMCRVAAEIRVFPVLDYNSKRSAYVGPIMAALNDGGWAASLEKVRYEFQRGGNEMLRAHKGN